MGMTQTVTVNAKFSFGSVWIAHSCRAACEFISVGWRYDEVVDSAHPQISYQSAKC